MAQPLPPPPYEIPLSEDDLILLGKIAVLWGQVDEGLNSILRWVLHIDPKVFESLLGSQMIGSRVSHMKAAIHTASRPEVRDLLQQMTAQLENVLPRRNAAMHGRWGRFPKDPTFSEWDAGTFNHQKPQARFYSRDLPNLYRDLVAICDLLGQLGMLATEDGSTPTSLNQNKVWFAPAPPDERAVGLWSARGDRIIRVESKSPGWLRR